MNRVTRGSAAVSSGVGESRRCSPGARLARKAASTPVRRSCTSADSSPGQVRSVRPADGTSRTFWAMGAARNRSVRVGLGRSIWRRRTASWWRNARISMSLTGCRSRRRADHSEPARHGEVRQSHSTVDQSGTDPTSLPRPGSRRPRSGSRPSRGAHMPRPARTQFRHPLPLGVVQAEVTASLHAHVNDVGERGRRLIGCAHASLGSVWCPGCRSH